MRGSVMFVVAGGVFGGVYGYRSGCYGFSGYEFTPALVVGWLC